MPATRSPRSSSSLSSDSNRRLELIESPNFSFNDYVKFFDNDDAFYALQVALFEWQDLTVKTHEIKHLNSLIQRLQDEINRQQEYVDEIFDGMEAAGLHQILKKHFVRDNGTIRTRRRVEFNIPRTTRKYSLHWQRSTPYPPPTISLHDSIDDSLPTGDYRTISCYPLDGGFIHHYIRPSNPEPSSSNVKLEQQPLATIQANWTMPTVKIDWLTYQGGFGSRFNPIIIEDDWNRRFQV